MDYLRGFSQNCKIFTYILIVACFLTYLSFFDLTMDSSQRFLTDPVPLTHHLIYTGNRAREKWIETVTTTNPILFYFSAYLNFKRVTVISIAERRKVSNETRCLFFNHNGSAIPQVTQGEIYLLPDYRQFRFTASFVHCKLPDTENVPYAVALMPDPSKLPTTYIPIVHHNHIIRNFTVCVSPLFNFDRDHEIVEMIELNRILGAQYLVFYNKSIKQNVNIILEYYRKLGLVEIIPWFLPARVKTWNPTEIHYHAQFAALNDCTYRNKGVSRYVVFQDVDEFIIPRKHRNWNELMPSLPSNVSSYLFRSTLFRKDWPDINDTYLTKGDRISALKYKTVTILKQFRETKIFPKDQRTKYIAKTECVEAADIHYVWSHRREKNCATFYVDESIGLVHHYRNAIFTHNSKILDNRINEFKTKLFDSLNKSWTLLKSGPLAVKETQIPPNI